MSLRKYPSEQSIRSMLTGGDRRSIGRADEVVELIRTDQNKSTQLMDCLWESDERVRMRAADALEKLSRDNAQLLRPYKSALIGLLAETKQKEVRWHLALIVPRLQLSRGESDRVAGILETYLEDRSSIVKTFAMQGLADLASQNAALLPKALDIIRALTRTGTPAMRARGRMLLKQFETTERPQ